MEHAESLGLYPSQGHQMRSSIGSGPPKVSSHQARRSFTGNNFSTARREGTNQPFNSEDWFVSDANREDGFSGNQAAEKHFYAKSEQRTICLRNLSDRSTHKDIVDVIRGGALLDIYLRASDRSASVSFVEGSAAQAFMYHAKRNDIYIHGKRVCLSKHDLHCG